MQYCSTVRCSPVLPKYCAVATERASTFVQVTACTVHSRAVVDDRVERETRTLIGTTNFVVTDSMTRIFQMRFGHS